MKLEIITEKPSSPSHSNSLLFIHGMCQTARVWQDNCIPFFVKHGYVCHAINLRGHGKSETDKRFNLCTLKDYTKDVEQAIKQIGENTIIIGHSMGGLVTQLYLQSHKIPGAVLLSPIPPSGMLNFFLRYVKTNFLCTLKIIANLKVLHALNSKEKLRRLLFRRETPEKVIEDFLLWLQDESYLVFIQCLLTRLKRPPLNKTPLLIIGGTSDYLFTVKEYEYTGRFYETKVVFLEGMPHHTVCDHEWQITANHILTWLHDKEL